MEPKIENQELYNISEVQLIYRNIVKASLRPSISCSKDAYEIIIKNWDHDSIEFVEQFKIVLMNNANKVLGIYLVSTGGVNCNSLNLI